MAVGRGVRISVNTLSMRLILTRQPFAEYCNFPPGIPRGSVVKNPPAMQRCRRYGFTPWVGKIPWLRKWQPTPVFFTWEIPWTVEPGTLVVHGITKSQTPLRIHAGTFYPVAVGTNIKYHLITQSFLLVSSRQVFRTTRQFRPFSLNPLLNLILYCNTIYF